MVPTSSISLPHHADVVMRLDMNHAVGSGHAMRCMAIASAIECRGGTVLFVVSDDESMAELEAAGRRSVKLAGDCMCLAEADGEVLGRLCEEVGAHSVLVDAYGVTDGFFDGLKDVIPKDCRVTWIDDLYTYELGMMERPVRRTADRVIDYMLGADPSVYEAVYAGSATELYIAAKYAPIRDCFYPSEVRAFDAVERILVTSGSTNDEGILETMTKACLDAAPDASVNVVVGSLADFESFVDDRVCEMRGMTDLSPLMRSCDLCISAAGTTLYELSAIGVPAIAVPIVENQVPNAQGFAAAGLGIVVENGPKLEARLREAISRLAEDSAMRKAFVDAMCASIDCDGSKRIAEKLYG